MNHIQRGILTLLKSAITGENLPLPEEFSLVEADKYIRRQGLVPLVSQGAGNCGLTGGTALLEQYRMRHFRELVRSERQMHAVEQVFRSFESHGIDYLPVKGCNMKSLYPQPELRVMGDADILIRPEQHAEAAVAMKAAGFTLKSENAHVFEWLSDSLYVEVHKSLIPPEDADYYAYFRSGWDFAVHTCGHRYDLSAEDAFLFQFVHFARHYRFSGIGCRHVVDLWVYRRAYPSMNEAYLERELKKMGLAEFYRNTLRLLEVWFENAEPDDRTELMTAFIFSGGSWGTEEAQIYSQQIKAATRQGKVERSRFQLVVAILFPPLSRMSYSYRILLRAPWMLPVMWVVRWFDIVFLRPQKIRRKMKILGSMDDEKLLLRKQQLQAVGLNYGLDDTAHS